MSLRTLTDRVHFLHRQFNIDGSGGYANLRRGIVGIAEHVVHEMSHAAVLDLPLCGHFDLSKEVGDTIKDMSYLAGDWQEILALACETVVLRRLGVHLNTSNIIGSAATNMSEITDGVKVCRLVRRAARTKVTRQRADKVLKLFLGEQP